MDSSTNYVRTAGILYLVIAVCGGFSIGYVPSVIVDAHDAVATADNLANNLTLFRMGILGDTVVLLAEVALTAILFYLFRPVNATLSLVAAAARFLMVAVMGVILIFNTLPLAFLTNAPDGFTLDQAQALALVSFRVHDLGVFVWQLFFSVHLLALGYMILRSRLVPAILGWMMLIGSLGYLFQGLLELAAVTVGILDGLVVGLLVVVTAGELAFAFWLLIKGVSDNQRSAV